MVTRKNEIIIFCLLLFSIPAFAQRYKRDGFRFAPFVGFGASNMSWSQDIIEKETKSLAKYTFGTIAEFMINRHLYFQPGIALSGKGFRNSYDVRVPIKEKYSLNYIDIPLNFKMTRTINMTDMALFGGPYLSCALWGKNTRVTDGGSPVVVDARFGPDKVLDDYKRLDAGLNIGVSIETSDFQYMLQYGVGFANISVKDNNIMRNRFISFTVAYMIN